MISTQHQSRIGIKQFDWLDKIGNYQGRGSITGNPPTDDWVSYGPIVPYQAGANCNTDFVGQEINEH